MPDHLNHPDKYQQQQHTLQFHTVLLHYCIQVSEIHILTVPILLLSICFSLQYTKFLVCISLYHPGNAEETHHTHTMVRLQCHPCAEGFQNFLLWCQGSSLCCKSPILFYKFFRDRTVSNNFLLFCTIQKRHFPDYLKENIKCLAYIHLPA